MNSSLYFIYLPKNDQVSCLAFEYLYSMYEITNLKCYIQSKNLELEEKLLQMQQKLLNKDFSIRCEQISPEDYQNISQKINTGENTIILIELDNLQELSQQFQDLLQKDSLSFWVHSLSDNLLYRYSSENKNWNEQPIDTSDSYIEKLNLALRRSYKEQTTARFDHTIRVILTAQQIIKSLSLDQETQEKIMIACAYHDFAKNWEQETLVSYFQRVFPQEEYKPHWALHGPVAADYLLNEKLVEDTSVLTAIAKHTEPIKELDIVGTILVLADKLEPLKANNFPPGEFELLWEKLRKSKYQEVFTTLLTYSPKKRENNPI